MLQPIGLVLMLRMRILRGCAVDEVSPGGGFSFASKFWEKPMLIVCCGSVCVPILRPVGSIARAYSFETVTPGAYCQLTIGEIEWRIRLNGPNPGKNPKNVGDMPAENWSRFPCWTQSPPVN